MNLKKLLQQCRKQNREAQEELYRCYSAKLFVLCLKYSGNRQEAEDALQDGFIKIFEKIDSFRGKGSFEGWMSRIMINTAIKKQQQKQLFLSVSEEYPEENGLDLDLEHLSLDFLLKSIQELPAQYRLVFSLFVLDGYSHKEIAQKLKITEGTSKSNLARARLQLKKQLEEHLQAKKATSL